MATVATGSTAEMSEPKAKDSTKFKWYATPAMLSKYSPLAITMAEIVVPKMANTRIEPMFWKKFPEIATRA